MERKNVSAKGEKTVWKGKDGFGMEFALKVRYRKWRIDQVRGKALMIMEISNPRTEEVVDYCPTHKDICEGIVDTMLQLELENDLYTFEKGVLGKRRSTQIFKKIRLVEEKLSQWREKALQQGLKEGVV